jgi:hypothetical protein
MVACGLLTIAASLALSRDAGFVFADRRAP